MATQDKFSQIPIYLLLCDQHYVDNIHVGKHYSQLASFKQIFGNTTRQNLNFRSHLKRIKQKL